LGEFLISEIPNSGIMSTPKRHHYLPDFFLRGFGTTEKLAVFDRVNIECRTQSSKNIAVIGNYYTFEGEDGSKDYEIEKMLCDFEGKAKPVITRLDRGEKITTEERVDLGYFLGLLLTRVPRHEKAGDDMINLTMKHLTKGFFPTPEAVHAHFKKTEHAMTMEEAASFHSFVHEERYTVKRSRNEAIMEAIEKARMVAPYIILMDWAIVHTSHEDPFVLSDAPLGFIVDEKDKGTGEPVLGILSDRVTKVFPLTMTTSLLLGSLKPKARLVHFAASEQQVDELNTAVIHESERLIVGRDEKTVREAIRKAAPLPPPGSRMRLDEIPHPTDPLRSLLIMNRTQPGEEKVPLKLDFDEMWRRIDVEKKSKKG
jgi:hypothetical protein